MKKKVTALSPDQVRALPAMVDAADAFRALNIGRDLGYQLIKAGDFPIKVLSFGRIYRVRRADLLEYLGLTEAPADTPVPATT
ncbi:hypothetical protein [Streptomyces sp. MJP52]|uniref:hypothetical protein n=1 Tax=Streptomyces sp. MJP52 TaxID=2940555 RepID=UPI002473CF8E|nr:hypothetical protein [Streptomyces sp. MJP52]MDH6226249.1 hypothetical protein [Streptomyces sp. MJP52]